jgi:hypothetical protein
LQINPFQQAVRFNTTDSKEKVDEKKNENEKIDVTEESGPEGILIMYLYYGYIYICYI